MTRRTRTADEKPKADPPREVPEVLPEPPRFRYPRRTFAVRAIRAWQRIAREAGHHPFALIGGAMAEGLGELIDGSLPDSALRHCGVKAWVVAMSELEAAQRREAGTVTVAEALVHRDLLSRLVEAARNIVGEPRGWAIGSPTVDHWNAAMAEALRAMDFWRERRSRTELEQAKAVPDEPRLGEKVASTPSTQWSIHYSKKRLSRLLGIDFRTLEDWAKEHGIPLMCFSRGQWAIDMKALDRVKPEVADALFAELEQGE